MDVGGISILIASRKLGNSNWRLPELLESLQILTLDPTVIEVLLKFDADDSEILPFIETLSSYPFRIQHIIAPQTAPAFDLLTPLANPQFQLLLAGSDDLVFVERGWDQTVFQTARKAPSHCILKQWISSHHSEVHTYLATALRRDLPPICSKHLSQLWHWAAIEESSSDFIHKIEWLLRTQYAISVTYFLERLDPRFPLYDRHTAAQKTVALSTPSPISDLHRTIAQSIAATVAQEHPFKSRIHIYRQWIQRRIANALQKPQDAPQITLCDGPNTTYLVASHYHGHNILRNQGLFKAFAVANGPFDLHLYHGQQFPFPTSVAKSEKIAKKLARKYNPSRISWGSRILQFAMRKFHDS